MASFSRAVVNAMVRPFICYFFKAFNIQLVKSEVSPLLPNSKALSLVKLLVATARSTIKDSHGSGLSPDVLTGWAGSRKLPGILLTISRNLPAGRENVIISLGMKFFAKGSDKPATA